MKWIFQQDAWFYMTNACEYIIVLSHILRRGEIIDFDLTCGEPLRTSCLFTPGASRDRVTMSGISTQKQEVNTMRRGWG